MIPAQERLDQLRAVSGQRWVLVLIAVITPVLACLATGVASGSNPTAVSVAVAGLAVCAVLRPDAHTDIFVLIVIVGFWLAQVDDVVTPWAIVVALAMLGHHVVMSMMAAAPNGAVFDPAIVRRWLMRSGLVSIATGGVWATVFALDHRRLAGNAALLLAALVALVLATVGIRARSLPPE